MPRALQVFERDGSSLVLSSSRSDVKLWDGKNLVRGCLATWEGVTKPRFNGAGTQVRG